MLGLGNSRRGMKSPPLLIAGLFACVFVLGINYWITSTRCTDLQHQLAEMEGRMRRAAAERGAVEIKKNEFEEKLEKQREQIDVIRSLHGSEMKDAEKEKNFLLSNITSQEKIIQKLQDETKTLQMNYDKQHQEMELFREGQAKKLDYELTQCSIKMKELTEQCEEKLKTITDQNGGTLKAVVGNADVKPAEKSKTLPSPHEEPVVQQPAAPQTNKDVKEKKETSDNKAPKPSTKEEKAIQVNPAGNPEERNSTVARAKESSKPQNPEEGNPNEKKPGTVGEPHTEDLQEKKAEEPVNVDFQTEIEDEVERENLISFDGQQDDQVVPKNEAGENRPEANAEKPNDKAADYNGDDGNEAEPEAEKQAVLIDPNRKGNIDEEKNVKVQILEEEDEKGHQML